MLRCGFATVKDPIIAITKRSVYTDIFFKEN